MARKHDFDPFYYGIGMKLDDKSLDQSAEKLENRLNKVVDNITGKVRAISSAVSNGVKDVDTKGLVSALVEAQEELGRFNDFNPKELKGQISTLEGEFKGLKDVLGDVAASIKGFQDLGGFISDIGTRLKNIEISSSKDGIRAFKSDLEMMADYAQKMLNSGDIDASGIDKYFQRIKNGFASLKASGNPIELFADKDIAKYFVNISTLLRDMGAPVANLRTEFFELSSVYKEVFEATNLPGENIFKGVKYQIEEVNHALQKARLNIAQYEAEIAKLENGMRDWHEVADASDKALIDAFQSKQTVENLEAIINKIDEYQTKIKASKGSPDLESYEKIISLSQTAEGILRSTGKRKAKPLLDTWADQLFGLEATDLNAQLNDWSTKFLGEYRAHLQTMIDGIRNTSEYKELQGAIGANTIKLEQLTGKKAAKSNPSKRTSDVSQLTGEKFTIFPTLTIDKDKWAKDINDAIQHISDPENGTLRPVQLRVSTNKGKLTTDLNKIREAIEDALLGVRGAQKDEQGNPISKYETSFDTSLEKFYKKLEAEKPKIFKTVNDFQTELKEAFKFQMTVDGLGAKETVAKELGSFVFTFIENLNQVLEKNPLKLTSNIDELINKIKEKAQNIKIEGEVGLKAGDINASGLGLDSGSTGLAKDSTVKDIYNLLSRGVGAYVGSPVYVGAPTSSIDASSLQVVEAKANAEERGAEAVERKVSAEEKAAEVPKQAAAQTVKTNTNSSNQQIYDELHYAIKNQLDAFTDVKTALDWVKSEADKYSKTLSQAKEGSEEYIEAQIGLTTLLHQWRYKIGNASKSKEPFRYEKYLGAGNKQGWINWSNYLKDSGIAGLLPEDFKTTSQKKFYETYGLKEPKKPKFSSTKSKKIEESAEEMIARDFEHTKQIAEHILKLAKWAKALGTIADGLDYTITEADFKDRDTVSRNGVTYTKQDLEKSGGKIFSKGSRLTAEALDEFVTEYENSKDKEFKELFGFVKKLIDVQRASQGRLDAVLKGLDGTDIATKYGETDDKSEYLAKNIKSTFGRLMGKSANKTAQNAATEILSRYGMLDSFQKLATEKNPEEAFKTLQDNVLNDANIDKMIGELSALDGNVGKTYQNFINLLKIAKEFMLTSNSISTIGQEARKWIGGTKEQRDKYRKTVDPRTGRIITTDEVIGVENKVIENGLRQMIQEFRAIFINEAGERILGFNDGKGIVDNFVGGNASFAKIINALVEALAEAVDIQISGKGTARDYTGVRKHERVADLIDRERAKQQSEYKLHVKTGEDQIQSWINNLTTQINAKRQEVAGLEKQLYAIVENSDELTALLNTSEEGVAQRTALTQQIVDRLKEVRAQKEARIREIDATQGYTDNAALQSERKTLESEMANIDDAISKGIIQTVGRIQDQIKQAVAVVEAKSATIKQHEETLVNIANDKNLYGADGKSISATEASRLLPQAEAAKNAATANVDAIRKRIQEYIERVVYPAMANNLSGDDASKLLTKLDLRSTDVDFSQGKITKSEYIEKLTQTLMELQALEGKVDEAAARAMATERISAKEKEIRLEREIELLNERIKLVDATVATESKLIDKNNQGPIVAVEPEIKSGEVAAEVRENVAQTPATAVIQPTLMADGAYTYSEQIVRAILGGHGLATESHQQTIIDLLKSGINVNGKVSPTNGGATDAGLSEGSEKETKKKTPKIPSTGRVDAQADEINKLTNVNKDSNVYKRYESMMAQLNDALKQAEEKGDAFTTKDADRIRGLMTNISGLGRKIIEASNEFEQMKNRGVNATEYIEDGIKSLETEMLNMAHNDALSKNALLSDVAYDDVKQRMTYVLTDLEGSTTRVTLAYKDMIGEIITTSDKTTDSVRKIYRAVEGEMTRMVQSGNLVDDLTGNSALKNSDEYKDYTKAYGDMMQKANDVKAKGTLATKEEKNELTALVKQVETARIAFEKLAKASSDFYNRVEGVPIGMTEGQSIETQMKNYVLASQSWTAAQRKMIEETWKFNNAQNSASYSVEKNKGQLASMSVIADMGTRQIGQYTEETKKYKSGMEKFMDSLKNKWKEVARYLMTFGSMYRVFTVLRRGVTYVKEIDSALTELKKVTDETEESYERFLKTAAKTADKVGSTIKEIVSSTADWARIGYSLQDAVTLAESTAVLLNVSEFQSIDEATSALTSTLQAFSYTAEQSMDVVDVLNEVGNNFAISSDGIATALKDSASSLVAANNSYEEAVALIASANRVVNLRHGL